MNAIIRFRDPSGAVYADECADRWADYLARRRLREGAVSVRADLADGTVIEFGRPDPDLRAAELCAAVDYHYSAT